MKSLFKTVALITIFSVITRFLGFVFRIYLSRKLGAEYLGLFQVASSVIGIMLTLVSSGLPLSTAKFVAKYEAENRQKNKKAVVGASLIIAISLSAILCLLIFIGQNLFTHIFADDRAIKLMIIMLPAVFFSSIYCVFRGAMWGKNDYFSVCITEFIEQVARIVITVILLASLTSKYDFSIGTAQCFSIACTISAILSVFIYFKKDGKILFKKGEYKNILRSSAPVTGVRVTSSFIQPLSAIIIPAQLISIGYTSSQAMSAYGVMMGMVFPLLFIPMAVIGSLGMVLIPNIAGLMSQNNYDKIASQVKNSIQTSIFCSAIFIPLYLGVGDLIGVVLYDNVLSGVLLQISAIIVVPIALCNITSSMLNALNLEVKSFKNYLAGAIAMFASMFLLTKSMGINSIILGLFLCMSIVALLNIRMLNKKLPGLQLKIVKTLCKYSLICLPCALLAYLSESIFLHFLPVFVSCTIGGIIGISMCLILLNTFNIFKVAQVMRFKRRKLRTSP